MDDAKSLTLALGGRWHGAYGTANCPAHENTQTPALSLSDGQTGKLLAKCHAGCSFSSILTALRARGLLGAATYHTGSGLRQAPAKGNRPAAAENNQRLAQARSFWNEARSIEGTPAETYLRSRGITCRLPASLRFLPNAYHSPSKTRIAAMVADINPTGGVHRTFISQSGSKLASDAKMLLGPSAGGAVHLSEAAGPLVICEGIETGLSLLSGLLGRPAAVLAALSTAGMQSLILPPNPHCLTIATDGDAPGKMAGRKLAERANALGWKVTILPAPAGRDWNDVLAGKERAR